MSDRDEKAVNLMSILHDIKHGAYPRKTYKELCKNFPNWREVEFYDPVKMGGLDYLFEVVLKDKES
jgi:broad specificity phosphatase PhoE